MRSRLVEKSIPKRVNSEVSQSRFCAIDSLILEFLFLPIQTIFVFSLINSNMTLTMFNLHQKTGPKVKQDFKGQGRYDKVNGKIKVTPL